MRSFARLAMMVALVAGLVAPPGRAATPTADVRFVTAYNVPSTSYNYCTTSEAIQGQGFITTSGSSTTVTAVGTTVPFEPLAVGDSITVRRLAGTTADTVYVTAKASSTSITVSSAVNWENSGNGYNFTWKDVTCGTAATSGWVDVSGLGPTKSVQWIVTTINATSITFEVQCRAANDLAGTTIFDEAFTATGSNYIPVPEKCTSLRVGVKLAGDAGDQSVSAHLLGE